jgi:hypothetical protein
MQDEMAAEHEEKISQILQEIETQKSQPVSHSPPSCDVVNTNALGVDTIGGCESPARGTRG